MILKKTPKLEYLELPDSLSEGTLKEHLQASFPSIRKIVIGNN